MDTNLTTKLELPTGDWTLRYYSNSPEELNSYKRYLKVVQELALALVKFPLGTAFQASVGGGAYFLEEDKTGAMRLMYHPELERGQRSDELSPFNKTDGAYVEGLGKSDLDDLANRLEAALSDLEGNLFSFR